MTSNKLSLKASEGNLAPVYKFYFNAQYKEALSTLDILTKDFPNDPILFVLGGDCYVSLKQYQLAISCYDEAIRLSPNNLNVYPKKIEALRLNDDLEKSLLVCNQTLKIFPNNSDLYFHQAIIFHKLGEFMKAVDSYNKSIKLDPKNANAYCNKSDSLENLRRFDEAIISAKEAIKIKPDLSLAYFNLGVAAMQTRDFNLSKNSFDKAIDLEPDFAKYKFAKATLLLLFGDFKNGWSLFESRWNMEKLFSPKIITSQPEWNGVKNSKLLVWAEQGLGDQVMYSALLPDLNQKCKNLVAQVEPRLISLLTRSFGHICTFYPDNKPITVDYDEHIAMGSLCKYLRNHEKDFDTSRYGFLKDDQARTVEIKNDLLNLIPKENKICGISWKSISPKTGVHKTLPLKNFIEMFSLEGYSFVSLQYGDTKNEIKEVKNKLGIDIISYEKVDNFNDIDGLVSLIQACDTVVSVDNITCQLSGALGKEIHVLLTYGSWWGWMVDRSDSPWYDSVKIYRQEFNETWSGLFERLKQNIKE
jgi:tetratricopeptide (TPR) repeat protein